MQATKLFIKLASLSMLVSLGYALNYDNLDLRKFQETNKCQNCNLTKITIYSHDHQNAILEGANLSSSTFYGDYTRSNFRNTIGIESSFAYIALSETQFNNANFMYATFKSSNLTYADFTGANVTGANFSNAVLYGAKISNIQLASAKSICDAILPDGSKGKC